MFVLVIPLIKFVSKGKNWQKTVNDNYKIFDCHRIKLANSILWKPTKRNMNAYDNNPIETSLPSSNTSATSSNLSTQILTPHLLFKQKMSFPQIIILQNKGEKVCNLEESAVW